MISNSGNNEVYNMPSSAADNIIMEVLAAGTDIADLAPRKQQVNHDSDYIILERGDQRQVIANVNKTSITVEIPNIDKFVGCNKGAKKMFVLVLIKANSQALYKGRLTRDYVSFPLKELVDMGIYSDLSNARRGFKNAISQLTEIKIMGHIGKSKKNKSAIDKMEILFTGYEVKGGQCKVYLNPRIDWTFLAQYYMVLPEYYFQLPNLAGDLLYYVFYLARQHTKDIAENGYFNIGFRAIHCRLMLPDEKVSKNPTRDIRNVILDTIKQIEDMHNNIYGGGLILTPICDEQASITEFIDKGYLKVEIMGGLAKTFANINSIRETKIEAKEKRKVASEEAKDKWTISSSNYCAK